MENPTIQKKLGAAIFIMAFGAENTGVRTLHELMWPYTDFEIDETKRVAARLVASVCTAALGAVPLTQIDLISKDLASYLSFALGDGWPDDKDTTRATE